MPSPINSAIDGAIGLVTVVASSVPAVATVEKSITSGAQTFVNHNPELAGFIPAVESVIETYASELGAGVYAFISALLPHLAAGPPTPVNTGAAPAA